MNTRGVICLGCGEVALDVEVDVAGNDPRWRPENYAVVAGGRWVVWEHATELHIMLLATWVARCRAWPRLRP